LDIVGGSYRAAAVVLRSITDRDRQ
jgi:hypothetical protein